MLLKQRILDGIAEGRITLAFRRWKRPTVKAGGSLRTAIGVLAIESVDVVDEKKITKQDAKRAGYSSRDELLSELNTRRQGGAPVHGGLVRAVLRNPHVPKIDRPVVPATGKVYSA